MNENELQVKALVEEFIAANPQPHIPITVRTVQQSGDIFNIILSTTAKTHGDWDYKKYDQSLEDFISEKADVVVMLSGLQPEHQKSSFNRDPAKR